MNNEDEIIEILDDFENDTIIMPPFDKNIRVDNIIAGISVANQGVQKTKEQSTFSYYQTTSDEQDVVIAPTNTYYYGSSRVHQYA